MKLSKSILSPSHGRDPPLTTSLSRRLHHNGSTKGTHSPMFPPKKPGSTFENPEPSSPKVTCIGQVKMMKKTKTKFNKAHKSRRESSFSKLEHKISHRWVLHLPLTVVYETLRELTCLFPCFLKKDSKRQSSCNNVFTRMLVDEMMTMTGSRRHVFEDFKEEKCGISSRDSGSICVVPPKNALLLMRCRSDPAKMAHLTNRFAVYEQENSVFDDLEENEETPESEGNVLVDEIKCIVDEGTENIQDCEDSKTRRDSCVLESKMEINVAEEAKSDEEIEDIKEEELQIGCLIELKEQEMCGGEAKIGELEKDQVKKEERLQIVDKKELNEQENEAEIAKSDEKIRDPETNEVKGIEELQIGCQKELKEQGNGVVEAKCDEKFGDPEKNGVKNIEGLKIGYAKELKKQESEGDIVAGEAKSDGKIINPEKNEVKIMEGLEIGYTKELKKQENEAGEAKFDEKIGDPEEKNKVNNMEELQIGCLKNQESVSVLPDSLLLMMCEPKLSMEVSKETWVVCCNNNNKSKPAHTAQDSRGHRRGPHQAPQPPRLSCSGGGLAAIIEEKLVNAVAYEPFVLTRCKSEPMSTAAAKLGVSSAGVGF